MRVRGFIVESTGLESRCFVDSLGSSEFYWVEYGKGVTLDKQKEIHDGMTSSGGVSRVVEVEVVGRKLSGGAFGHLNQYKRCLRIDRVINIGPPAGHPKESP